MPSKCCVKRCQRFGGHLFPPDKTLREKWTTGIRREFWWKASKYSVVCDAHFDEEDYIQVTASGTKPLHKKLKKSAVPHIFPWTQPMHGDHEAIADISTLHYQGIGNEVSIEQAAEETEGRCCSFMRSPAFGIYASHSLSSWGDRMWHFAIGLYLVFLSNQSLRLAAVYGFSVGGSILLFGGVVGNWVDKNGRLQVVQIGLVVQNLFVILGAVTLGLYIHYLDAIALIWDGQLGVLLEIIVILFAIVGELASLAVKISIEKDWIVVIAGKDSSKLADLNATIRRLDLLCNILAPIAVGQFMSFASMQISTIVIAAWNVVSCVVEFSLLLRVYHQVPILAKKKRANTSENEDTSKEVGKTEKATTDDENDEATTERLTMATALPSDDAVAVEKTCTQMVFQHMIVLVTGWRTYWHQYIVFAGLGLACLYMSVLSFSSITTGFMYSQGIPEWAIGVGMGLGSITGLIGTYLFIFLRRKIGHERTGIISFNLEIACLIFCVVSVWTPGSPFDLNYASRTRKPANESLVNCSLQDHDSRVSLTLLHSNTNSSDLLDDRFRRSVENIYNLGHIELANHQQNENDLGQYLSRRSYPVVTEMITPQDIIHVFKRDTYLNKRTRIKDNYEHRAQLDEYISKRDVEENEESNSTCVHQADTSNTINISIILFMIGVITSRAGLWMADLTVTQLLQEKIEESERGIVNGVQTSLNKLMDMLHFVLVIIAPRPETFGILVVISFSFICLGSFFFSLYSRKVRGHLFHFTDINCNRKQNTVIEEQGDSDSKLSNPKV